ncbi:hypothetical protein AAC387_Pa12g1146 [Persea americana]
MKLGKVGFGAKEASRRAPDSYNEHPFRCGLVFLFSLPNPTSFLGFTASARISSLPLLHVYVFRGIHLLRYHIRKDKDNQKNGSRILFGSRCCPHLFKFKSIMRLPDSLPIGCQLVHLKKLFMELNFDDATMVSPLLFLLRSCPNLEQLSLKHECSEIGFPIETNYWEKQRPPMCLTNHLMTIRIENIPLSNKNVIEFVKFLLINARVLIRMRLVYRKSSRDQSEEDIVVNELLLFKRASQNALLEIKPGGRYEC